MLFLLASLDSIYGSDECTFASLTTWYKIRYRSATGKRTQKNMSEHPIHHRIQKAARRTQINLEKTNITTNSPKKRRIPKRYTRGRKKKSIIKTTLH